MEEFRYFTQIITRKGHRSIVRTAAANSGERLFDRRTKTEYDFRILSKRVLHKAILIPEGYLEYKIQRLKNRETLWNAVEYREFDDNAPLAQFIEIVIPEMLGCDEKCVLFAEYFTELAFVDRGQIADLSLCLVENDFSQKTYLLKILLTLRCMNENGYFGHRVSAWTDATSLNRSYEIWQKLSDHFHTE